MAINVGGRGGSGEDACREGGEVGVGRTHAGRGERQDSLEGKAFKKKIPHKTLNSKAFYKCCS